MFLVRLAKFSKSPVKGKRQISNDPTVYEGWDGWGLELEKSEMVALDYDEKPAARRAWVELVKTGLCNLVTETRHGAHFVFKGKTRTRKFKEGDLIKANGHIVWPPSVVRTKEGDWQYRFVLGNERTEPLPFPEHLYPDSQREVRPVIEAGIDKLQTMTRATHYAMQMASDIDRQSEDMGLWVFACRMVRESPNGFGLSVEEAWPLALMVNERCSQPLNDRLLRRKLEEAKRKDHA